MEDQELKTLLAHQTEEIKREIGVLTEHFENKVEGIAEQYSDIKATLDEHGRILMANQESLLEIQEEVTSKANREPIEQLAERVTALENKG